MTSSKELPLKTLLISFLLLSSFQAFSGDLAPDRAEKFINTVAKSLRYKLYRSGYENVTSVQAPLTKVELDEIAVGENNRLNEQPLTKEQIARAYSCFYRNNCQLFLVKTTSDYYGGTGVEGNFILLNTNSMRYDVINWLIYAE